MHTVSPLKRKAQVNLERYERRKQSKRACPPMDVTEGVTAGDQGIWTQEVRMLDMIMSDNNEYSLIDKIVTVCCALCNCCESVVPFE